MKCLEFKELCLADPNSEREDYVAHSNDCEACQSYLQEVRELDADLADSLHVTAPENLIARLKLQQEIEHRTDSGNLAGAGKSWAIAASVAALLFTAVFMLRFQGDLQQQIGEDQQLLMAGVVEHMHEVPYTPVWDANVATQTANTLLASYDDSLRLNDMPNLQFSKICPMGKYRGLHAGMQTEDGQITFAYIKGEPVDAILTASYEGYLARVKPVRGGNLIIVSRNKRSLEQADEDLRQAMYWDI